MREHDQMPSPDSRSGPELDQKQQRCLALSAVFQAATLVTQLAQHGHCDERAYNSLIDTLFVFEADSTLAIYDNNLNNIDMGLKQIQHLSKQSASPHFTNTARYALSMISLQKHAQKSPQMLDMMRSRLEHMQYKHEHFVASGEEAVTELADGLSNLYQETLSTLKFRIQVQGNMEKLTNKQISDKIRALLFAGFRSALLWHQLGGSKWQLIFKRGELERAAEQLLKLSSSQSLH